MMKPIYLFNISGGNATNPYRGSRECTRIPARPFINRLKFRGNTVSLKEFEAVRRTMKSGPGRGANLGVNFLRSRRSNIYIIKLRRSGGVSERGSLLPKS